MPISSLPSDILLLILLNNNFSPFHLAIIKLSNSFFNAFIEKHIFNTPKNFHKLLSSFPHYSSAFNLNQYLAIHSFFKDPSQTTDIPKTKTLLFQNPSVSITINPTEGVTECITKGATESNWITHSDIITRFVGVNHFIFNNSTSTLFIFNTQSDHFYRFDNDVIQLKYYYTDFSLVVDKIPNLTTLHFNIPLHFDFQLMILAGNLALNVQTFATNTHIFCFSSNFLFRITNNHIVHPGNVDDEDDPHHLVQLNIIAHPNYLFVHSPFNNTFFLANNTSSWKVEPFQTSINHNYKFRKMGRNDIWSFVDDNSEKNIFFDFTDPDAHFPSITAHYFADSNLFSNLPQIIHSTNDLIDLHSPYYFLNPKNNGIMYGDQLYSSWYSKPQITNSNPDPTCRLL